MARRWCSQPDGEGRGGGPRARAPQAAGRVRATGGAVRAGGLCGPGGHVRGSGEPPAHMFFAFSAFCAPCSRVRRRGVPAPGRGSRRAFPLSAGFNGLPAAEPFSCFASVSHLGRPELALPLAACARAVPGQALRLGSGFGPGFGPGPGRPLASCRPLFQRFHLTAWQAPEWLARGGRLRADCASVSFRLCSRYCACGRG